MRAIWSGTIGFGLVNIPVKLYSAVESSTLDLDMLDKRNHANIRFERINADTGKPVKWEDIVKGYKYKNGYVVLSDADFEKASAEKSKVIEIEEFVTTETIDSVFYDSFYYIESSKGGERAYALLREALKESEKSAIGTFVLRAREHLCMIRPYENLLILMKLRFAEELRSTKDITAPAKTTVKPAELKMALSLIQQLTPKKFNISKYKDKYNASLLKIIHAKAKGKPVASPKLRVVKGKAKDIMSQLKASIQKTKKAS
ncbi:MAG: Ku protein [Chitinophagaceae bacterium]